VAGDDQLTIDQLAQRTGMTVRNVRAHQSRGLLPPPEVRGRTGYYGPEHLARIDLIRELQTEGFSLELIGRMLETANGSSAALLRFTRTLRTPFADEEPQIVTGAELAERWGASDPSLLKKAEEIGLLRPLGDGTYEEISPRLARAGEEMVGLGFTAKQALEVAERLRRHAEGAAKTFARVFLDEVWKPFERAGHPDAEWPAVQEALERLRPLAAESLLAVFQLAMDDAIEQAFGREVSRLDGSRRRKR
jgi:DNA-binding transcriptional MerR regulator